MGEEDTSFARPVKPRIGREVAVGSIISGAALAFGLFKAGSAVYYYLDTRVNVLSTSVQSCIEHREYQTEKYGELDLRVSKLQEAAIQCRENYIALQADVRNNTAAVSSEDFKSILGRVRNLEMRDSRLHYGTD